MGALCSADRSAVGNGRRKDGPHRRGRSVTSRLRDTRGASTVAATSRNVAPRSPPANPLGTAVSPAPASNATRAGDWGGDPLDDAAPNPNSFPQFDSLPAAPRSRESSMERQMNSGVTSRASLVTRSQSSSTNRHGSQASATPRSSSMLTSGSGTSRMPPARVRGPPPLGRAAATGDENRRIVRQWLTEIDLAAPARGDR
mmetsp:Transcript_7562/g.23597  ORF Transcript_7562/g.23597 Transcript_7562/m.23597 type:complete len:200 (-) Transcript_7562:228-827(-)